MRGPSGDRSERYVDGRGPSTRDAWHTPGSTSGGGTGSLQDDRSRSKGYNPGPGLLGNPHLAKKYPTSTGAHEPLVPIPRSAC